MMLAFSGSYASDDVLFLLKPIIIEHTPIAAKEALIQSGLKHYSEMLSYESIPSNDYTALFYQAMANNQDLLARHLIQLTEHILAAREHGVTLVSLARAGTPIGVLIKHILNRYYKMLVSHYSISILKGIGIDQNALCHLLTKHSPESLVFIDGWTGKGSIARQLEASLQVFAGSHGVTIPSELFVLTDLSGSAMYSVSSEDYLIPSCLFNCTISGLVSRSIYSHHSFNNTDFHGCMYYRQFEQYDLSRYFIDAILVRVEHLWQTCHGTNNIATNQRRMQQTSQQFLSGISQDYGDRKACHIKPGIGEATRALLRREVELLLLRNSDAQATDHLRWLAKSRSIPFTVCRDMPYQAVALIKEASI